MEAFPLSADVDPDHSFAVLHQDLAKATILLLYKLASEPPAPS
jgi:hypothetical protein